MDSELLESISRMAVEAVQPKIMMVPGIPEKLYLCVGNSHTEIDVPQRRDHKITSLASVEAFRDACDDPAVWVDQTKICVVDEESDRLDRAVMPLAFTPQIMKLRQLQVKTPFKQGELVFLLRTMFASNLSRAGDVLNIMRQLKFRSGSSGTSEISHGKASIGRSIEAEITGSKTIPESIELWVQVWDQIPSVSATVDVAIDLDPANETVSLMTLPGSIESAIGSGLDSVYERLSGDCPTYFGTP